MIMISKDLFGGMLRGDGILLLYDYVKQLSVEVEQLKSAGENSIGHNIARCPVCKTEFVRKEEK